MSNLPKLIVHQSPVGYVGKIDLDLNIKMNNQCRLSTENIGTIIVIDRSGSMGDSFSLLLSKVMPKVFEKLNYSDKAKIDMVLFDSVVESFSCCYKDLYSMTLQCRGANEMVYAIQEVEKVVKRNSMKHYRLLVISDGELNDQDKVVETGNQLAMFIKQGNYIFNSKAVRFYTSSSQPETRALASLLQLNTVYQPKMIDVDANGDVNYIVDQIAALFMEDGMDMQVKLVCDGEEMKDDPWVNAKKEILLEKGSNLIWLNSLSNFTLQLPNGERQTIKVEEAEKITSQNYKTILNQKIDLYLKRLKISKVINTQSSDKEMNEIINFFNQLESGLEFSSRENQLALQTTSLESRVLLIKQLIERRVNSITYSMNQIRYDNRVSSLNAKQQSEYLKDINISSCAGKVLVKSGVEIDDIVRKEAIEMAKHFKEIELIDDSKHIKSFYSSCTTLEGIKTLIKLTKDPLFSSFLAIDILKLINITGIAAKGPKGDFFNPKEYTLEDIYPGCYISISDMLVASECSGRKDVKIPGTNNVCNTVVPCFEDQRIHSFLLKYAPKTLEYLGSLAMRRLLVEITSTWETLFFCGVTKMMEMTFMSRRDKSFQEMELIKTSYETVSGQQFVYKNDMIVIMEKPFDLRYLKNSQPIIFLAILLFVLCLNVSCYAQDYCNV